jgi:hypothetical protein
MASNPERFSRFAVADWSGAKGSGHPGIALAVCGRGDAAPELIAPPGRYWSRQGILDWLLAQRDDLLIGFDFSFAPPFVGRGAYLPGDPSAETAREFWAYVDLCCDDEDLGAASFLETRHRRHFWLGKADGRKADYLHHRVCEALYNAGGGGKPSTVFDALGAAQVAKASFAGMRLLARLDRRVPIWPFDPVPKRGPLVVEIYTQIAARAAGMRKGLSKIRDADALDAALASLGSRPHAPLDRYSDHATDAILTAAWLRHVYCDPKLWAPSAMTPEVAMTEGWTLGVR